MPRAGGDWKRGARSAALVALGVGALALSLATLLWPQPDAPAPPDLALVPSEPRAVASHQAPAVVARAAVDRTPLPARLLIPSIGVDAPLTVRGIDGDGAMENPLGPEDVAWYDFTSRPGAGGNAVLSGHVDYRGFGPAVFAQLKRLQPGDAVEVVGVDGSRYRYEVTALTSYPADSAPAGDVLAPTGRDVVTLITCAGTFRDGGVGYDRRLVVRAERV